MSAQTLSMDEAGEPVAPITRAEWLQLRAYWRERDGKEKGSSAQRRKYNLHREGRPPLPADAKTKPWQVRLTARERRVWKRLAKAAKMSPAQWLRIKLQSSAV